MPLHKPVTAIFDIGKTNKKFLLFDENYAVVERYQTELEQTVDDDGDPCEDLGALESWIGEQIIALRANEEVRIEALNFSAYGASLVHLDKKGNPVTPLYNYLKPYPEDLLAQFYASAGGREVFSLQTASPPMGMLNSGLQLYWLKHQKPGLFERIKSSLHFPNYLGYLFTRKKVTELTSIGCHTALWNFEKINYHNWLKNNKLDKLFPIIRPVSTTFDIEHESTAGPGIHDSSAALVPYLIGMGEPFILVSTGTWSISLNPFNDEPLIYKELKRDCLCYLDIYGNQVKASRFFLGAEYVHQEMKIREHFSVREKETVIIPDRALIEQLIQKKNKDLQLELEKAHNSGPYPIENPGNWQVSKFLSYNEAYHQLMLDLVAIQAESIKLALGPKEVDKFIITGGFSQNMFFVSLLASFFPDKEIYTSSLPDASALGAAMVITEEPVIASQARNDLKELLGLNKVAAIEGLNLYNYSWV